MQHLLVNFVRLAANSPFDEAWASGLERRAVVLGRVGETFEHFERRRFFVLPHGQGYLSSVGFLHLRQLLLTRGGNTHIIARFE